MEKASDNKKKRARRILIAAASVLLLSVVSWVIVRHTSSVTCTAWTHPDTGEEPYTESEQVFTAMSLSYLVYGCEGCGGISGTVSGVLDTQRMGIILENADVSRTDKSDPASALIDTASFIRQSVGHFRFLTDRKDARSSFYGAAFADDERRVVWIAYSGSVSFKDAVQSSLLVVGAGPSAQEKQAFLFYEDVLATEEIRDGYDLILTGHSLGGALACMVSRESGAAAVTISGTDGLANRKINDFAGDKPDEIRVKNYLTSPQGCGLSFKNLLQRAMLWGEYDGIDCRVYPINGMVDDAHCVFGFVRFEDGDPTKPVLPETLGQERD